MSGKFVQHFQYWDVNHFKALSTDVIVQLNNARVLGGVDIPKNGDSRMNASLAQYLEEVRKKPKPNRKSGVGTTNTKQVIDVHNLPQAGDSVTSYGNQ